MQVLVYDENDGCYKSVTLYVVDFGVSQVPGTPVCVQRLGEIRPGEKRQVMGVIRRPREDPVIGISLGPVKEE